MKVRAVYLAEHVDAELVAAELDVDVGAELVEVGVVIEKHQPMFVLKSYGKSA